MKNAILVSREMIRRVNDRLIERGAKEQRTEKVYSSFLGRDLDISFQCDTKSINSAWKKASEQLGKF